MLEDLQDEGVFGGARALEKAQEVDKGVPEEESGLIDEQHLQIDID